MRDWTETWRQAQDIRQYEDDLKNKVTAKELRYEKKNQDTITVDNFANFVMTTNNSVTLRVSNDDRRLVLFECSDMHRGDRAYFDALCTQMRGPGVARALYQFFMERDLSKYTSEMAFQEHRPRTELYNDTRANSLRPEQAFFSALVNHYDSVGTIRILISELYSSYKLYAGDSDKLHHTTFGRLTSKMAPAIEKDKIVNGHKTYTIKMQVLRKLMTKSNSYDVEAELPAKPVCTVISKK